MRSVLSSDGKSRTCRAGLPARAVGSTADHRTAPDRASSARRPSRVWTTIMSGPACSTSSAVASDAAVTRRCIKPPSPFFWGSVCSNSPSLAQRCSPVARWYSATTGGPAARRPWTSRVPLCGSTRRVTICARFKRRESNTTAPVTGSKTSNKPGRAASMRRDPSTMRTLSAGSPPSSGFSHTVWPRSVSSPASAASVDTRSAPAGVTCCQRMSPFILRVHAGVAPDGAGAAVCACAAVGPATRSVSESRARRAETADMAILRWPPISPQGEPQRKSVTPCWRSRVWPTDWSFVNVAQLERFAAALSGRYTVERAVGEGGMAIVYRARDLKHDRVVAIKVLKPELGVALGSDRFLREIKLTAQLSHPHILPLLDSGEVDGWLYYVMPYVEGESLRQRLLQDRQLPVDEALRIAREVADGLDSARRHGVVHRDIKAENILLEEGHAVIADFGIARAVAESAGGRLTATGIAVGTPAYMSPEQMAGPGAVAG